MSEEITQEQVTEGEVNDSGTDSTTTTGTTTEPKFEYPAKFLKPDGQPDFEKLAKSYIGLEKKLGSKPTIPASSVEEYSWEAPDDSIELQEENVAKFKEEALAQGFSNKQYQFLMSRYSEVVKGMQEEFAWSGERAATALQQEWGKDYKSNLELAKTGFEEFASSSADPNDAVWNHPEVMKLLARLGSEVREDSISSKGASVQGNKMGAEEVKQILQSKEYRNGDRELHAKVAAWYQAGNKL